MKKLLVALLSVFAISCSTMKVESDRSPDADFSHYSTFKVVYFTHEDDIKEDLVNINGINRQRIENAITNQLIIKALEPTESEADLLFLYAADVDIEKGYISHTNYNGGPYMGYRGGRYGRYYGGGAYGFSSSTTTTQETQTEIGRLRIACVDPKTKKLLWIGSASDEVKSNNDKIDERIKEVVGLILERFPN